MSTVSSASLAPVQAAGRSIDRCLSNGVLWTITGSGGTAKLYYSTDNGTTWTYASTSDLAGAGGAGAALFIDHRASDGVERVHLAFRQSGTGGGRTDGSLYYTIGTFTSSARTAITWATPLLVEAYSGTLAPAMRPDLVAHPDGTGWTAHIAYGRVNSTGTIGAVYYARAATTSGGTTTISTPAAVSLGGLTSPAPAAAIDFHHTGDGKTPSASPHLYLAAFLTDTGTGQAAYMKGTYSGGAWTWPASPGTALQFSGAVVGAVGSAAFDGTRFVVAAARASSPHKVEVRRVLVATMALELTADPPALTDGNISAVSVSYDAAGDLFVFVLGATSADPKYAKRTAAGTWDGAWTALATTSAVAGTLSAKRGAEDGGFDSQAAVWAEGTSTVYARPVTYNVAPDAPTLTSPVGGAIVDRTATVRLAWTFSDADGGDTQSAANVRYRVVGDVSWTTVAVGSPNNYLDVAGGTFSSDDYEWQAQTYDALGVVGPWSASEFFTAATPPTAPTITAPVTGATIPAASADITWSTPNQDAYQLRRVADLAGSPDTGTVYADTGTVTSAGARTATLAFPTNSRWEHVQLRVRYDGLWSTWVSTRVFVSFTPPTTPTLVVTPSDATASIAVAVTNPAPGGGVPATSSVDIWRREGSGGDGIRVAVGVVPNSTWTDWTPGAGVSYEYRAVATGDNGTNSTSAWAA